VFGIVALLALAGALLALSFVSYATLRAHVNAYAVDRSANISRTEYDRLVLGLRLLGSAAVGAAFLVVAGRNRVDRGLGTLGRSLALSARELVGRTSAAVGADSLAHRLAFVAACGLGLGLRLHYLGLPMRYDEATSFNNYASRPLYIGLTDYREPNNHLFHTLLVHISTGILGTAPWAIRLPALIAGVLLVPATYVLVRTLYEKGAGLLAAGLVACSSTLIEYSVNARGYTIVTLLFLLMLIVGARVVETNSTIGWAGLVVLGTLALYTLPTAVYAVGGVLAWMLVCALRRPGVAVKPFLRRLVVSMAATTLATALLYAPVAAVSGVGSITSNPYVSPKTAHAFLSALPGHLHATWRAWNRDLPVPVQGLLGAAFLGAVVFAPRISRFRIPPAVVVALWAALLVLLQRVIPYPRVWLFAVPLYLGTAAAFLGYAARRLAARVPWAEAVGLVAVVVWLSGLVLSSNAIRDSRETGALLDAPRVAHFLRLYLRPGDTVQATGSDSILEYYLRRDGTDPAPLLYSGRAGRRVVVVVNSLGGQTLSSVWPPARSTEGWSRPVQIARYPSAALFVVARS
jgi:Dolichyl-phosphate-mannose-protein mannosyltransferase